MVQSIFTREGNAWWRPPKPAVVDRRLRPRSWAPTGAPAGALGASWRPSSFDLTSRRVYRPAIKTAVLETGLTFHRLRHSAGDHMRETGEPLEVIQKRLGHASIHTTADVYGSLPVAIDKAASDRLNKFYESARGPFTDMDEEK